MIVVDDIAQGSPEWFDLKLGVPSASSFSKIVTTKGALSKSADGYMYELAAEKITGGTSEGYTNPFMEAMLERENESRPYYELISGHDVRQVGFVFEDQKRYGCSPDGLVYVDNAVSHGLEMKNVLGKTQAKYLIDGSLPYEYFQQVQGSILVTGLERWDFLSYCPNMPHFLIRCEPDLKFQAKLKEALEEFCHKLSETIRKLESIK